MSVGLVLPAIALLGASPEQPIDIPQPAPVVQVAISAEPQTATPAPARQANPDVTAPVAIPLDPLVDPATSPAAIETTPVESLGHTAGDPLEGFNRRMFSAFQKTDRKIVRPVALAYRHVVPKPVRSGLRNVLSNLNEPIVFLNDLLQLKPGRAVKTLIRFLANSTIGIGGLVDVAKTPAVRLPHHDNGFGNTLAYYGVGPGPYLFLPFVGPTTLRDLIGGQGDGFVLPLTVGKPFNRWQYQVPKGIVTALDQRAESDDDMKALLDGAIDPYATLRSVYLQNRTADIRALHSRATARTTNPLDDPLSDPATGTASPLDEPLNDPAAGKAGPLDDPLADPAAAPEAAAPPAPARAPANP